MSIVWRDIDDRARDGSWYLVSARRAYDHETTPDFCVAQYRDGEFRPMFSDGVFMGARFYAKVPAPPVVEDEYWIDWSQQTGQFAVAYVGNQPIG